MITDELRIAPWLLDIQTIYLQPEVESFPRGREILSAFPNAERVLVDSHWKIPGLHGFEGNVDESVMALRRAAMLVRDVAAPPRQLFAGCFHLVL